MDRTARGAHFHGPRAPVASVVMMADQLDQQPDLQTQLESLLHQVWTEEARWRERCECDDDERGDRA